MGDYVQKRKLCASYVKCKLCEAHVASLGVQVV